MNWKDIEQARREWIIQLLLIQQDGVVDLMRYAEKHDLTARRDHLVDDLLAIEAAIAAWPEATHNSGCAPMQDGGPCYCGTAALNARRKEARRVAGLEEP